MQTVEVCASKMHREGISWNLGAWCYLVELCMAQVWTTAIQIDVEKEKWNTVAEFCRMEIEYMDSMDLEFYNQHVASESCKRTTLHGAGLDEEFDTSCQTRQSSIRAGQCKEKIPKTIP